MSEVVCIESDEDVTLVGTEPCDTSDCIIIGEEKNPIIELDPEPGPSSSTKSEVKRIKPTLISTEVTSPSKKKEFGGGQDGKVPKPPRRKVPGKGRDFGSFKRTRIMQLTDNALDLYGESDEEPCPAPVDRREEKEAETEKITKEFRQLIQTCKSVDSSLDMEKLIRKKLVGYYKEVPHEFVTSKSFRDLVKKVTEEIRQTPHLIYLRIIPIIEELKPRRRRTIKQEENGEEASAAAAEESERNAKKAAQIRKLNKALVQLKRRIDELDQEEVDFDEDLNSAHMKVERYKKRACQIYEKLCDISGESKHAQRSVRKPIKFHGTVYPEFNKTLQAFVNRTNIFPDYFDVKKCLEHCNKTYDMRLRPEEIKAISQDAFVKVGKLLQKRRKIDLYEMISYYVGPEGDPADQDADLQDKLGQNKQHHAKIAEIIDKFAEEQVQNGGDQEDGDPASDEDDTLKVEPLENVEINLSILDDVENVPIKREGTDLPHNSNNVDANVSLPTSSHGDFKPPRENTSTPDVVPLLPESAQINTSSVGDASLNNTEPLGDPVNMDDAIEHMLSTSIINPFDYGANTVTVDDLMLPDFPLTSD